MFLQSNFASRLNANYIPSDAEIEEIRTALTSPLYQLSLLDEQIAQMQAAMDKLAAECALLKGEIDQHQALISPI
ncbi:hypothetical protein B0H17DRAFT_924564 [Mycena rosella]|uniref:Uncharacterized protein n=1 Tax=Mycena rosella TaxID=1033263 RepID=A0AAD7DWG1_MYCRO|nr:hypothetical protein B0H17DRAFT_924564 [Mycena rosella]